ncbi:MAG: glutamate--tRNA ligase [Planctomycetota bacterium]|nr:glutamate--tRNA ligase [Planctomycetota bacterium]
MSTRVRFAPSPTGRLHTGGARCALFNYLYARVTGGKFILRIEDTDVKRSSKNYLGDILDGLKWLGMEWDEGPYYQSERLAEYSAVAQRLIEEGLAYRDPEGSAAVYFKMPKVRVSWEDLIHGEISFDCSLLDDLVLIKSDGTPTYNFACVVDDVGLGVTHVIRGDDHISNTPKQIALYRALGKPQPKFAHIPLILGPDKKRLSKRHGAKSVLEYRDEGILSDALFNFLALLSWSPGDEREFMSRGEIIKKFSLKKVKKTAAVFDYEKLLWLNQQYLKRLGDEEAAEGFKRFLPSVERDSGFWLEFARLYKVRVRKFSEIKEAADFFFGDVKYDESAVKEHLFGEDKKNLLGGLFRRLESLQVWEIKELERVVREYAESGGREAKEIIHPVRVALTGRTASPGLFEVMVLLGRQTVLERLKRWVL